MAELSGFEVLGLLKEIGATLRGAYVNNIYRLGESQLVRFRSPDGGDAWVVLSPKKGVWISKEVAERADTTEFTTRLRAELERARFVSARQADLDRVFELDFEGREKRKLIVELMPPGNIIVTDGEDKVLLVAREVRTPSRRVMRGTTYRPPEQSRVSPLEITPESVGEALRKERTAGSAIGRHIALPRKYVSECLTRLGIGDESPSSALEGKERELVAALGGMVEEARDRPRPCICETPRGDEIFAFPPSGLEVKESAASISELCDRLFLRGLQSEPAADSPTDVKRKEMQVTISRLRSESESLAAEAAKAREAAAKARSSTLAEAVLALRGAGVKTAREPTSAFSAASLLFDHAKRLEAKAKASTESADRLESRMPRAGERGPRRTKPLPQRRRDWYERFRWFFTSGGKLAVGGRDAQTNSALVTRHLEDNDTIYHADLFGSPFFILKGGESQSDEEVSEVAQATVAFSSAWKTGLGAADAYWVSPEQIRTAAPSGEYLQRGSFAITGKKNFVTKIIVELAVGIDSDGRFLAGPESAIRASSRRYLVLRPQKEKGSDTAKRVLKDLSDSSGSGPPAPGLDEVLRMLPSGGGKVIRRAPGGSESR